MQAVKNSLLFELHWVLKSIEMLSSLCRVLRLSHFDDDLKQRAAVQPNRITKHPRGHFGAAAVRPRRLRLPQKVCRRLAPLVSRCAVAADIGADCGQAEGLVSSPGVFFFPASVTFAAGGGGRVENRTGPGLEVQGPARSEVKQLFGCRASAMDSQERRGRGQTRLSRSRVAGRREGGTRLQLHQVEGRLWQQQQLGVRWERRKGREKDEAERNMASNWISWPSYASNQRDTDCCWWMCDEKRLSSCPTRRLSSNCGEKMQKSCLPFKLCYCTGHFRSGKTEIQQKGEMKLMTHSANIVSFVRAPYLNCRIWFVLPENIIFLFFQNLGFCDCPSISGL